MSFTGNATGRNINTATGLAGTENNSYAIIATAGAGGTTTPPTPIASNTLTIGAGATGLNLTIQNNVINSAARAIAIQGSAPSVFPGLLIENNFIGNLQPGAPDQVYSMGVTVQGSTNCLIRRNVVVVESFLADRDPRPRFRFDQPKRRGCDLREQCGLPGQEQQSADRSARME